MSPSKHLSFHHDENLVQPQSILNLSSYTASLASSSSPASGISHDSGDGRSSSSSPNNLNNNMYSGYGHACSHCTSSFLTRDLLEKHELMHISNATMVSYSHPFFHLSFKAGHPYECEGDATGGINSFQWKFFLIKMIFFFCFTSFGENKIERRKIQLNFKVVNLSCRVHLLPLRWIFMKKFFIFSFFFSQLNSSSIYVFLSFFRVDDVYRFWDFHPIRSKKKLLLRKKKKKKLMNFLSAQFV